MRHFDYHRPTTVDETVGLLSDLGDEAALLAGGTSLMNMAKLGLAEPEQVIALRGVAELHGVDGQPADGVTIGAMTTLREIETSPLVRETAPGLAEAAHHVATVRIRNQATVGGNLVHADPNQDVPPMLIVYDALATVTGPEGSREVAVADLFLGYFETVVGPEEILTSVRLPRPAVGIRTGYLKFLPRTQDDYSTISVAAGLAVEDGRIQHARIAIAGGGSVPVRCREAEAALVGNAPDPDVLAGAASVVPGEIDPISDGRGTGGYKRDMARVCSERLLRRLVLEASA